MIGITPGKGCYLREPERVQTIKTGDQPCPGCGKNTTRQLVREVYAATPWEPETITESWRGYCPACFAKEITR
jgi:hypothetical protein